jgi:hypothetical protein
LFPANQGFFLKNSLSELISSFLKKKVCKIGSNIQKRNDMEDIC